MGAPCPVYLIDDHPVVVVGLRALLEAEGEYHVVGHAGDYASGLAGVLGAAPAIVIVDGSLPGGSGIALVSQLRAAMPSLLLLALTLHEESTYVREFFKAGANGFVLKRTAADDLLRALRCIRGGDVFVDPGIANKVLPGSRALSRPVEELSEREEMVVRLVAQGFSNKEISRKLSIGIKTVETYRARAYDKLGTRSRASLVNFAISEGWFGVMP
ncbi:MAG: response regulator transcription factor [Hyphomicrobiales bacterium]|nr:MAG: response regulator transcription factor [Hyphomicrobiales bacterium]